MYLLRRRDRGKEVEVIHQRVEGQRKVDKCYAFCVVLDGGK